MNALIALVLLAAPAAKYPDENRVQLKDGPDKALVVGRCAACHSQDYIPMNSPFLDKAGWTATINKMINAFGAPIQKEDVEPIATYLAEHYGKK
jgi:hypothetical protein